MGGPRGHEAKSRLRNGAAGPTMVERTPNLHTVAVSGQPLGVECVCGRRVLLAHDKIGARQGNMKELRRQEQLKCLGCGQPAERAQNLFDRRTGPRF